MKITLEEIKNPDVRIGPSEYPDALEVAMEEVERLTDENERLKGREKDAATVHYRDLQEKTLQAEKAARAEERSRPCRNCGLTEEA